MKRCSENMKETYRRASFAFVIQKQPLVGVLRKSVLKLCSKFTREHPCRSVISILLLRNFIEITLRHWCSPVILLYIFRTPFPKNTYEGLLLCYKCNGSLQGRGTILHFLKKAIWRSAIENKIQPKFSTVKKRKILCYHSRPGSIKQGT